MQGYNVQITAKFRHLSAHLLYKPNIKSRVRVVPSISDEDQNRSVCYVA